ncbi:MAG TPA: sodium-dependent transporter [Bacteroidetes bacterium]|nr:sodium-dependent transporter [Bacteroidota bacterium]
MERSGGGKRETWGSRIGFILAAAGSAIGLGNIWRFPYVLGENGGFAFLLVYLICVALIGIPIMGAEFSIGRASRRNPVGAFRKLLPGSLWSLVGVLGLITGLLILSYYSVIAGWTVAYMVKTLFGLIGSFTDASAAAESYNRFVSNSGQVVLYHFIFMVLCVIVVRRGVKEGIERWSKILMPTLFVLLLLLIFRAVTLPGSGKGLAFLFAPDFGKLNGNVILTALGQAFYSLSLGMGVMITYGSYLDRKTNLFASAGTVASLDALIAVLAGIAVFPALFAMGFSPQVGEGLTFQVLPLVFSKLPLGSLLAFLFFLLLSIAALTSAISLLEVFVSFATDELRWLRSRATVISAAIAFLLGVPTALSFGAWKDVTILGKNFFQLVDFLSANILLPTGGILIAVFAGWIWKRSLVADEIRDGNPSMRFFTSWIWAVRILAPVAVGLILVTNLWPK